jgi:hypothetical protein
LPGFSFALQNLKIHGHPRDKKTRGKENAMDFTLGSKDMRRAFAESTDFHWCPNTKRVIISGNHDDKAWCPCPDKVHRKSRLKTATVEDYDRQVQQRLARSTR